MILPSCSMRINSPENPVIFDIDPDWITYTGIPAQG